ncbi:MAG TPA: homocysteine S-methyltransferase family protein, partial [Bryobacteraceae bacterium]|nr:homocysteine S-methyltransferase family protein [Bryobacteraceae bacterium]
MSTPRQQALLDALEQRILVIDGAMGTMIHEHPLSIDKDFLGRENCPEILVETRPDLILGIHRAYLEAGADIVETDTFGGMPVVLAEFDLRDRVRELNVKAVKLARQAADEFSTPEKPRFVAASMGPTTKDLNVTVTSTFEKMRDSYYEQAKALIEGGADILLLETAFDTGNLKS